MLFLLIKEHNITGLKYLCKHEALSFEDCVRYKGSGTYWKRHLKKYGNDVSTICIYMTKDKDDFSKFALAISNVFNIVSSNNWANLTEERGQGGCTRPREFYANRLKNLWKDEEYRHKNLKRVMEHIKKVQPLAAEAAKLALKGVKKTESHKEKLRGRRPNFNQKGSANNNAKKIMTPFGTFGSVREASQNINGYTYKMIWYRINTSNNTEWSYIND